MIWRGVGEELEHLNLFALRFAAAASSDVARAVPGASGFPRGMCSWACYAGGVLLERARLGEWTLWNAATEEGWPRHDWLIRDDIFVDFTAHQFRDFTEPLVGVGPNPLTARFPRLVLTKSTSAIVEHPAIMEWKSVIADLADPSLGAVD